MFPMVGLEDGTYTVVFQWAAAGVFPDLMFRCGAAFGNDLIEVIFNTDAGYISLNTYTGGTPTVNVVNHGGYTMTPNVDHTVIITLAGTQISLSFDGVAAAEWQEVTIPAAVGHNFIPRVTGGDDGIGTFKSIQVD